MKKVIVFIGAVFVLGALSVSPARARLKVASGFTGQGTMVATLNIPAEFAVIRAGAGATLATESNSETSYNAHIGAAVRSLKGFVVDFLFEQGPAKGSDLQTTGVFSYIFYHNITPEVEFGLQLRLLEARLDEESDIRFLRGVTPLIRLQLPF